MTGTLISFGVFMLDVNHLKKQNKPAPLIDVHDKNSSTQAPENKTNISEDTNVISNVNKLHFSVNAADKVANLCAEENNANLNLRVYITGGGCSGFQYVFTFDQHIQEDDTVIEQTCSDGIKNVKLLVDPMSFQYLKEAEIDYTQNLQGEQFVIRNPNAKTTCGCGSSFSIDDE